MQTSELEIYAKSALIVHASAVFTEADQTYTLQVTTMVRGIQVTHTLHTARNQVRKFKSLDTLSRLFLSLPHTQFPLLYVEKEIHA